MIEVKNATPSGALGYDTANTYGIAAIISVSVITVLIASSTILSIPAVSKAIGKGFDALFSAFEKLNMKFWIYFAFLSIMFYTGVIFYVRFDDNIRITDSNIDTLTYYCIYLAVGILGSFLISLALSFGGTAQEQIFAIFLILFVTFIGTLLLFLAGSENKYLNPPNGLQGAKQTNLVACCVIFSLLFLGAIAYVLFRKRKGKNVFLADIYRLAITLAVIGGAFFIGAICFTLYWTTNYINFDGTGNEHPLWQNSSIDKWSGAQITIFLSTVVFFFVTCIWFMYVTPLKAVPFLLPIILGLIVLAYAVYFLLLEFENIYGYLPFDYGYY